MTRLNSFAPPAVPLPLQPEFVPFSSVLRRIAAESEGREAIIALDRIDGTCSVDRIPLLPEAHPDAREMNALVIERSLKFLLWMKGGYRATLVGAGPWLEELQTAYADGGRRAFDFQFMGETFSERPLEIVGADYPPQTRTASHPIGRHLDGCRVGFDLGASDRKAAAVVDGVEVWTEEVVWNPRDAADPDYHRQEIRTAIERAASHMPRLDAIGGSSAGVFLDSRPMAASLFRSVPTEAFRSEIKPLFHRLAQEFGVPLVVVNDGDVTALAGSMSLGVNRVLGLAMGSSLAGGYVDANGNITGWLNELAFAPIDLDPKAPVDEWSGDAGCGVQYLTQQAVFRLAPQVGIELDPTLSLADRLKVAQEALERGHEGARQIWETIGRAMGYAVATYASFYDLEHVLILGRVTSGSGGTIIQEEVQRVLATDFSDLNQRLTIHLPDEKMRRVGQAVAAASLPETGGGLTP